MNAVTYKFTHFGISFFSKAVLSIKETKKNSLQHIKVGVLLKRRNLRQLTRPVATGLKLPQFPTKMFQNNWFEVGDNLCSWSYTNQATRWLTDV